MKKSLLILLAVAFVGGALLWNSPPENTADTVKKQNRKLPRAERKKARYEYFFNKLKDPKTNKIPENIRQKERVFAAAMNPGIKPLAIQNTGTHDWVELGPANVGGRTRALALDSRNSDVVLAAGVSGGIWKSTDGGSTWTPRLNSGSNLSITFLAQDPVSKDVWYATTGEIDNNTASGKGEESNYKGAGVYKSTDNGDSWSLMTYAWNVLTSAYEVEQTPNEDIANDDHPSPLRATSKVLLHEFNGSTHIFICTKGKGIWTSADNAQSFTRFAPNLTANEDPTYSDILIDTQGAMMVWFGPTTNANGFYRSLDGGNTFTDMTPPDYAVSLSSARCVMAYAPSETSSVYAFVYTGPVNDQQERLYYYDFSDFDSNTGNATFQNRSANLPVFERSIFGGQEEFSTQGGYDMALAVHPTNPSLVVLGYVNLVKSDDGFLTNPNQSPAKNWIGGNENPYRQDENLDFENTHHADQHVLFFDPNNPNTLWAGHDGGISKTTDVTADRVIWESKNNDYNVTQYYAIAIGRSKESTIVLGGTQDNGTPLLDAADFSDQLIASTDDVSSGDGAYAFVGENILYASAQNGALAYLGSNNFNYRFVEREDLDRLFIHPFAVDPNDEGTLFYTTFGSGVIARNDQFDESVNQQDESLVVNGWEDFNVGINIGMSAIKVSDKNPSHKLYFGGLLNNSPVLVSWENANTSADETAMTSMDLPGVAAGSWLSDIAINPTDGNEIILVYSNYNITGLYHSTDGGQTITAVEGNLGSQDSQGANGITGPSMRAAEIVVDWQGKEKYYVATSIGLYYTEALDGANTQWTLETALLDNVVIEDLDSRPSDNAIVAGTHGRGVFLGKKRNLAPVIEDQAYELNENSAAATVVGQIEYAEPEEDEVSFTIISGNTEQAFSIDAQGILKVNNEEILDFENHPTFTLQVKVSDGELSSTAIATVTLVDQNDAPTIEDQQFEVAENSPIDQQVGIVVATDQDQDALSYSISDGNAEGFFAIDASGGQLMVAAEGLDIEAKASYALSVKVSDGTLESEAVVTVMLTDVNEAPQISDQEFEIEEESVKETVVGEVEASDPENDDLTYSIKSGNTSDAFSIHSASGQLTVNNAEALDFDTNPDFSLVIEVSDGTLTDEATVTIVLTEIVLSVERGLVQAVKTYPNPVSDYLTVSFTTLYEEDLSVALVNMLGQQYTLYEGRYAGHFEKQFDLSSTQKGYYIIRIKHGESVHEQKLFLR